MISFIFVVGVYAMGTMSSGTAIRHRYKSLSLAIIIVMGLELESKKTRNVVERNYD